MDSCTSFTYGLIIFFNLFSLVSSTLAALIPTTSTFNSGSHHTYPTSHITPSHTARVAREIPPSNSGPTEIRPGSASSHRTAHSQSQVSYQNTLPVPSTRSKSSRSTRPPAPSPSSKSFYTTLYASGLPFKHYTSAGRGTWQKRRVVKLNVGSDALRRVERRAVVRDEKGNVRRLYGRVWQDVISKGQKHELEGNQQNGKNGHEHDEEEGRKEENYDDDDEEEEEGTSDEPVMGRLGCVPG